MSDSVDKVVMVTLHLVVYAVEIQHTGGPRYAVVAVGRVTVSNSDTKDSKLHFTGYIMRIIYTFL